MELQKIRNDLTSLVSRNAYGNSEFCSLFGIACVYIVSQIGRSLFHSLSLPLRKQRKYASLYPIRPVVH